MGRCRGCETVSLTTERHEVGVAAVSDENCSNSLLAYGAVVATRAAEETIRSRDAERPT